MKGKAGGLSGGWRAGRRWTWFALAAWLVAGVPAALPALERTVGVILLTKSHQFTRELADELVARGGELGFKIELDYAEFNAARQGQIIDRFIERRVDAVVLTPADSRQIDADIVKLNRAQIPVFTVDVASLGAKGTVVSHIASDNFQGGKLAAGLMAEALKGRGRVVIINHPKITSVMERVAGFREGLRQWPDIEVVADIPSWGQRDRAMAITDDLMLMMPDIRGIFAINDDSAMGALKSLDAAGRTKEVVLVGYDATPEARQEIERGRIFADVIQYPREIARQALRALVDHFAGKPVERTQLIKTGVYRYERR